tara:strand:+ start:4910 stop:5776 length:867 start_codon:yes stop_codon:yes gene_type:complete
MSEINNIIDVSEADFNDKVIEASNDKLIVVDFWAPWCGPCKQLTPVLEKIIKNASDKVSLVKINIDENQQIAGQLRIQSIPTVFAFKNKQIVNAFQGVIPEKQIIEFIEKCLDSKLNNDFTEFYQTIENLMSESKYEESKDLLLDFISNNSQEILAIKFYLECLIELKHFKEVDSFIESLEKEVQNKDEIKKIIKKVEIIKNNLDGPTVEELIKKIEKQPKDINLILELANKYFSIQKYEDSMELLLSNYPKNKAIIKEKMVEYFNVLGDTNEYTVSYRKKLSQIMFS